jgi:hypothetical protein
MAAELACPQIMSTSSATGSNLSWLGISKGKSASLQRLVGHCWRVCRYQSDGRADNFGIAREQAAISGKAKQGLISAKVQRAYLEG